MMIRYFNSILKAGSLLLIVERVKTS